MASPDHAFSVLEVGDSMLAGLAVDAWRRWQLRIERLTVPDAPSKELRPVGDFGERVRLVRQQTP